ncbi:MAG TPA: glycosyltransferase family 4 protein [Gaiellaceae bacterium]
MRVGYVTTYDSRDVKNWSGLGYFVRRCLERAGCVVEPLGPLAMANSPVIAGRRVLHRYMGRRTYLPERDPLVGRSYAHQVEKLVASANVDLVFSPGTIPIAYIDVPHPLVFWTDATFAAMQDFYPGFVNLAKTSIQAGEKMERMALERADLALYSSEWAAASAVTHYGADPAKIHVVPFGANLEREPEVAEVARLIEARPHDRCNLLFIGIEWLRKGGDVAVEATRLLNEGGLETRLAVVGSVPTLQPDLDRFVDVHGFIDKGTAAGRASLYSLFEQAHFLILPSRAECSAVVLCEANAFGVPCITTKVGGIPTIVRDGVNGMILDVEAPPSDFADAIREGLSSLESYRRLALRSHEEYRSRLNWTSGGLEVKRLFERLAPQGKASAYSGDCGR